MKNIRKAVPTDLESIVEHYGPKGDSPFDPFANLDLLKRLVDLNDLVVAEVDGSYAGFLYFHISDHPWFDPGVDKYAYILEAHVKPQYQGKGVATSMLEYAIEDLKKRSVKVAYVDTTVDNAKALRLYEKMGFKEFTRTIHLKKTIL